MSKSGYIRSMGTRNIENAKKAIDITIKHLISENILSLPNILKERVENIVATGAYPNRFDLELLADILPNSMYEPEQFPGIMFRPYKKKVCLLFASGKFVIVGTKSIEELNSVYDYLIETISNSE